MYGRVPGSVQIWAANSGALFCTRSEQLTTLIVLGRGGQRSEGSPTVLD